MAKTKQRNSAAAAARRRAQQHQSEFARTTLQIPDGVSFFSVKKAGTKRVDLLGYQVGKGNPWADEGAFHFERTFWVHRGIGPNNDTYVCPAKTTEKWDNQKRCPICEYRSKMVRDPNADQDVIKDLAPKERQLFNVIDLSEPDKGVQIWDMSYHLFGKLLDTRIKEQDEDENYEGFSDHQGGMTLKLSFTEQSMGQYNFFEVSVIDFKERKNDYDEDMMEQVHCLDDLLIIKDYDDLRRIFLQAPEEGEEESPPKRSTGKQTSKPKAAPKEEEPEEEEPEEEEPEEEEPEEEEPEEEEPEEEELPKRKGSSAQPTSNKSSSKNSGKAGKSGKKPKCPGGGTFGVDTDSLKECRHCDFWDDCDDLHAQSE